MPALPLTRPLLRTAAAAALLAALSGCTSEALDVDGFSAGACTDLAPELQDVDEALRALADDDLEPREAAARFQAAQEELKPVVESGGDVADEARELVTRLGFFRISVDTDGYDGSQDEAVRTALDDLAESCRA